MSEDKKELSTLEVSEAKTHDMNRQASKLDHSRFNIPPASSQPNPHIHGEAAQAQGFLQIDDPKHQQQQPILHTVTAHTLDWFSFETNMRRIVLDVLEPTVKFTRAQDLEIAGLKESQAKMLQKVDEMEYVIQKTHKRAVTLDQIVRQMKEMEANRRTMESQIKSEQENFKDQVSYMRQRTQKVEEESQVYTVHLQEQQKSLEEQREFFDKTVNKIETSFLEIQQQIRGDFEELRQFVNLEMYLPLKNSNKIVESHSEYLMQLSKQMEILKREHSDLQKQVFQCNADKLDKMVFEQYMIHTSKTLKAMHEDVVLFHKDLLATDNYFEKYLPFKILNYIHDSSKSSLPKRSFGKLITFLNEAYQHLEYVALNDDGKPRFPKSEYQKPELDMKQAISLNDPENDSNDASILHDATESAAKASDALRGKSSQGGDRKNRSYRSQVPDDNSTSKKHKSMRGKTLESNILSAENNIDEAADFERAQNRTEEHDNASGGDLPSSSRINQTNRQLIVRQSNVKEKPRFTHRSKLYHHEGNAGDSFNPAASYREEEEDGQYTDDNGEKQLRDSKRSSKDRKVPSLGRKKTILKSHDTQAKRGDIKIDENAVQEESPQGDGKESPNFGLKVERSKEKLAHDSSKSKTGEKAARTFSKDDGSFALAHTSSNPSKSLRQSGENTSLRASLKRKEISKLKLVKAGDINDDEDQKEYHKDENHLNKIQKQLTRKRTITQHPPNQNILRKSTLTHQQRIQDNDEARQSLTFQREKETPNEEKQHSDEFSREEEESDHHNYRNPIVNKKRQPLRQSKNKFRMQMREVSRINDEERSNSSFLKSDNEAQDRSPKRVPHKGDKKKIKEFKQETGEDERYEELQLSKEISISNPFKQVTALDALRVQKKHSRKNAEGESPENKAVEKFKIYEKMSKRADDDAYFMMSESLTDQDDEEIMQHARLRVINHNRSARKKKKGNHDEDSSSLEYDDEEEEGSAEKERKQHRLLKKKTERSQGYGTLSPDPEASPGSFYENVVEDIQMIKTSLLDYSDKQNLVNQELSIQLADIRQRIADQEIKLRTEAQWQSEHMKTTVAEECAKTKAEVYKKYDDMMNRHNDVIEEMVRSRKRELAESQFLFDRAKNNVEQNERKMNEISGLFESQTGMLKQILECLAIVNVVISHDEHDKQSIALFGANPAPQVSSTIHNEGQQQQPQPKPILRIDQNCYNCAKGENAQILKHAFKMACLLYQPSPIDYGGRVFSKDQLLSQAKKMVEHSFSQFISQHFETLGVGNFSGFDETLPQSNIDHPTGLASVQEYLAKQFAAPIRTPVYQHRDLSISLKHALQRKPSNHDMLNDGSQSTLVGLPLINVPGASQRESTTFMENAPATTLADQYHRDGTQSKASHSFFDNIQAIQTSKHNRHNRSMVDFESLHNNQKIQQIQAKTNALVKESIVYQTNLQKLKNAQLFKRAQTPLLWNPTPTGKGNVNHNYELGIGRQDQQRLLGQRFKLSNLRAATHTHKNSLVFKDDGIKGTFSGIHDQ